MSKYSVSIELSVILWEAKLVHKENPMYAVLGKGTKKINIAPSFHCKTWFYNKNYLITELSHRCCQCHFIQAQKQLPVSPASCQGSLQR